MAKFRSVFFVLTFYLSSLGMGQRNPLAGYTLLIEHTWENLTQSFATFQWPPGLYTDWFLINLPVLVSYCCLPGSLCSIHSGLPVFPQKRIYFTLGTSPFLVLYLEYSSCVYTAFSFRSWLQRHFLNKAYTYLLHLILLTSCHPHYPAFLQSVYIALLCNIMSIHKIFIAYCLYPPTRIVLQKEGCLAFCLFTTDSSRPTIVPGI